MRPAHDYVLLNSWRQEADGSYVLASRSVKLDEVPEKPEFHRGTVLPSGWFLQAAEGSDNGSTRVHYLLQINPGLLGVPPHEHLGFAKAPKRKSNTGIEQI